MGVLATTEETKRFFVIMENYPEKEIWKDVPGYEGKYQASSLGRIKSFIYYGKPKIRILKPIPSGKGYRTVCINSKTISIHILVAICFLNYKPKFRNIIVDHKNNIKNDNRLCNLQIISQRENCNKDKKKGTSKYRGVSWNEKHKYWISEIQIESKRYVLGYFKCEKEAGLSYLKSLSNWNEKSLKPKIKTQTSKYVGVYWDSMGRKWKSHFKINQKRYHVGSFDDEKEAFLEKEKAKELKLSQLQL